MAAQRVQYEELVEAFRAFVHREVPSSATVAVVSKGDHALLDLGSQRAWHFPQRADGVYAGYYPSDSAHAVAHLEAVRAKGAGYIAFPAVSLWWLEEYSEFGRHLQSRYEEIARDDEVGAIYSLTNDAGKQREASRTALRTGEAKPATGVDVDRDDGWSEAADKGRPDPAGETGAEALGGRSDGLGHRACLTAPGSPSASLDDELLETLCKVIDSLHYGGQLGTDFATVNDALTHYLEYGDTGVADPHPLFDASWYLRRNPRVRASGENPLVHFLRRGCSDQLDPNPYFDTRYYYSQRPALREDNRNALVDYVENAVADEAPHPNPLFDDSFYLATYRNVPAEAATPLEHFLRRGCDDGRFGSSVHRNMIMQTQRPSSSLVRGRWRRGTVVFVTSGERHDGHPLVTDLAEQIGDEYHVGSVVVTYRGPGEVTRPVGSPPSIVLEDYDLAAAVFRPSAVRFLARSLAALRPRFAVSDVPEVLEPLAAGGVGTFYMLPEANQLPPRDRLDEAFEHASRILVPSSGALHAASAQVGRRPTNVAPSPSRARPSEPVNDRFETARAYAHALEDLARSDLGVALAESRSRAHAARRAKPKIFIPCSDWNVSGVNASLEAVGRELIELGWEVEIIFTRREEMVFETVHDDEHLPALPYRFLGRDKMGVLGMWEALIAELETSAPCILFMAYDFLANSVAPALSNRVGVVAWAQADDGDYHEQAYRLGLYCNAVVCVSERIREGVAAFNPLIGERACVLHNSSVWRRDIATRRPRRGSKMRIVYTGRLVEYQKRILDFIDLAQALDRTGVPYEISLIGTFNPREKAEEAFHARGRAHLETGRIKIGGRVTRAEILEELTRHDFFVLLSDFEGFPLSLVEAMARGCVPIVAESPSGIPELIDGGDDGIIVSRRDYDEWAKLLVELWQDRRRCALMSRRARAKVRDQFSVEHVGSQFAALFGRIAREITAGTYRRPPALTWGAARSQTGDVLPPPSMHHPPAFDWV